MRNVLIRSFAVGIQGFGLCLLVALALSATVVAQTQSTTGNIQGNVLDANGAAIPGATVEVKNLETNLTRTFVTDEDGRFVALTLPPGRYSVTVAKEGFATQVVESTDLTVGQALNLRIPMNISGVT